MGSGGGGTGELEKQFALMLRICCICYWQEEDKKAVCTNSNSNVINAAPFLVKQHTADVPSINVAVHMLVFCNSLECVYCLHRFFFSFITVILCNVSILRCTMSEKKVKNQRSLELCVKRVPQLHLINGLIAVCWAGSLLHEWIQQCSTILYKFVAITTMAFAGAYSNDA